MIVVLLCFCVNVYLLVCVCVCVCVCCCCCARSGGNQYNRRPLRNVRLFRGRFFFFSFFPILFSSPVYL
jgi:hypothetical protein